MIKKLILASDPSLLPSENGKALLLRPWVFQVPSREFQMRILRLWLRPLLRLPTEFQQSWATTLPLPASFADPVLLFGGVAWYELFHDTHCAELAIDVLSKLR